MGNRQFRHGIKCTDFIYEAGTRCVVSNLLIYNTIFNGVEIFLINPKCSVLAEILRITPE